MTKRIGIIYGSTTGNTQAVAEQLAAAFGEQACLHDIMEQGFEGISAYDVCLFGIPTWDFGELQEDWADLWPELNALHLKGKPCALFGLGDQIGYGEWFLDAMGLLYAELVKGEAQLGGLWPVEGYRFEASKALTADGSQFVGLALDEDSQSADTPQRIEQWVALLRGEFSL